MLWLAWLHRINFFLTKQLVVSSGGGGGVRACFFVPFWAYAASLEKRSRLLQMSPLRLSDVVDPDSVRGVEVRGRGLNVALFGRALGAIPLGRGRLFIAGLGRGVGAALGRPRRRGFQERLQV